ncbi:hypothetical protein ACFV2X_20910 [Streptomyces sp. NPDC059679]|uniref:hypothetical protein n=1 Tax=Streptomyces sp. NPDC059679 TaxID=3346903 RepID=UPI0036C47C2C
MDNPAARGTPLDAGASLRNWSTEHRDNALPIRIDLRAVGTHLADQDFGSAEWLTRFLGKQVVGYDPVSWLGSLPPPLCSAS